ncbi:hypothetical protein Glove_69g37 [Diversispora epigaea]|uniref:Uncharacterized protein n=1 Tax=Diversispora epigaea TaxID=1348612 RepID=A0A397JJA1_9GLOM|nr:hypothetical protein Glove_69g37 [Diversispora epigaea]
MSNKFKETEIVDLTDATISESKSHKIFYKGWGLKENQKNRIPIKRIIPEIKSLLECMFHTETINPRQKISAQEMREELLRRESRREINMENIPKESTIANWITTFSKNKKIGESSKKISKIRKNKKNKKEFSFSSFSSSSSSPSSSSSSLSFPTASSSSSSPFSSKELFLIYNFKYKTKYLIKPELTWVEQRDFIITKLLPRLNKIMNKKYIVLDTDLLEMIHTRWETRHRIHRTIVKENRKIELRRLRKNTDMQKKKKQRNRAAEYLFQRGDEKLALYSRKEVKNILNETEYHSEE